MFRVSSTTYRATPNRSNDMATRYNSKSEALRHIDEWRGQYIVQGARGWYVVETEDMEPSEWTMVQAERRQMGITY